MFNSVLLLTMSVPPGMDTAAPVSPKFEVNESTSAPTALVTSASHSLQSGEDGQSTSESNSGNLHFAVEFTFARQELGLYIENLSPPFSMFGLVLCHELPSK